MRFDIVGHWDDFEHDGLLYCVQRMEEMLMVYTSHLYKVPVFNTFMLAYEFMHVYSLVEASKIDEAHIKNVLEEFISSFSSDVVIKEHISTDRIKYFVGRLKGNSLHDQKKTIEYLVCIMVDYPKWCEETLKKAVGNPKGKKDIELALRSYLPMLIGIGYHPHYIYRQCKTMFSASDVCDLGVLDAFFKIFDRTEHEYTVYFPVNSRSKKFQRILENKLRLSFDEDENSKTLSYDKKRNSYVDEAVMDIIRRLTKQQRLGTVANVLLDAQLYVETLQKDFAKDEDFKAADVKRLLQ